MFQLNYVNKSQAGVAPLAMVLVAAVGLVAFVVISSSAVFKNQLFSELYPKAPSLAAGIGTTEPVGVGTTSPPPSTSPSATPVPTPTPDTTPPTVSITSPLNGSTVAKNSTVNINANASDPSGISKVEFYVNSSLICTDTTTPYSCSWKVPSKPRVTYTLSAKAFDTVQNSASTSIQVTSK